MTEKIIIDDIDVSGCEFVKDCLPSADCTLMNCFCYENPNCYYKQLKRKEEECEKLKTQYNCNACGTCNGKEDYKNLARHYENALRQLHSEQQKVKELENENSTLKTVSIMIDNNKYKQALEEIKEIAIKYKNDYLVNNGVYLFTNEILQKCEVLDDK